MPFFFESSLTNNLIDSNSIDSTAKYGEDCSIAPCDTYTTSLLTCSSNVCSCPQGYFYLNKQCGKMKYVLV